MDKSIQEKQQAISNLLEALKFAKDRSIIPTLTTELDKLQQEKSALLSDLEEIKLEKPKYIIIDKAAIIKKINYLETVFRSEKVSNRDKKIAVKGFVKQLQYDPVENMLIYISGHRRWTTLARCLLMH